MHRPPGAALALVSRGSSRSGLESASWFHVKQVHAAPCVPTRALASPRCPPHRPGRPRWASPAGSRVQHAGSVEQPNFLAAGPLDRPPSISTSHKHTTQRVPGLNSPYLWLHRKMSMSASCPGSRSARRSAAPRPSARASACYPWPPLTTRPRRMTDAIRASTGVALRIEGPCPGGQVGAAYVAWPDGHRSVLTWRPRIRLADLRDGPLAVTEAPLTRTWGRSHRSRPSRHPAAQAARPPARCRRVPVPGRGRASS